jgi:hypothetical protein
MGLFSVGGSGEKSKTQSNMDQSVYNPFEGAYNPQAEYYGNQQNAWRDGAQYRNLGMGQMEGAQPYMTGAADFGRDQSGYMGQGGSFGDTSGMRDSLYGSLQESMNNPSQTGRMYEDIVGGSGNTYIDPMVQAMKGGMMENRDRMQSGTGLDAAQMGQGGSSRHAMQNAMTDRGISTDMARMEDTMRGNAYDTDLNWKMDIAKQADLGRGQAQDRAMGVLGGGDSNRQYGMGYQPTQQNLGMGTMAPWMQASMQPWQQMGQYQQGMQDPTVMTSARNSGQNTAGGGGVSFL